MASCTISLPLIGLVQIAHYITLGSAQGLSPNQLSSQLSAGVTGHSQGIVVAALIAVQLPSKKDTWSEFSQSALHAITTLFHIGFHGSVAFPQTSLPPKLVEITAENKGVLTSMLAVIGLSLDHPQKCINTISSHLPEDNILVEPANAQVSLYNGAKVL